MLNVEFTHEFNIQHLTLNIKKRCHELSWIIRESAHEFNIQHLTLNIKKRCHELSWIAHELPMNLTFNI